MRQYAQRHVPQSFALSFITSKGTFLLNAEKEHSPIVSNKLGMLRFQRSKSELYRYLFILFSRNTKHLFLYLGIACDLFYKSLQFLCRNHYFCCFLEFFLNGLLKFTPISYLKTFFTPLTSDSHKVIFVFLFVLGVKLSQRAFERPVEEESSVASSSVSQVLWILNGGAVKEGVKDWNEEFCFWYFLGVFCNKLSFTISCSC